MKAMLMGGATKTEFPSWSRTASRPLDDTFGAGELNIFNSYLMTEGGQHNGGIGAPTAVGTHGWDYGNALPGTGNGLKYKFVVPTGKTAPDLSILLTWNVNVPTSFTGHSLANFSMTLTNALGQTVDQSLSAVDNVEHIYLTNLGAGDYTLTISTDTARDFGLAWRMSTLSDIATADFDEDGDVDGRDFLRWQRGFGQLINAQLADGDADGDGDVDAADLAVYRSQFGAGGSGPPPLILAAVPEPGSVLLMASGLLAFALKRRR
jgi:PEP-CTERM motif